MFVAHLNKHAQSVKLLFDSPGTRGKFELKSLSLDVLSEYGFDVSTRMGDVLIQHQDLSDLGTIKDVYRALFPNARDLHSTLADTGL